MKFRRLSGRVLIASLIGIGMIAPVVSSVNPIVARADDAINVDVDFDNLAFQNNQDSYVSFSQPANDQPAISGGSNFTMTDGGLKTAADGTETIVNPCIAKEGSWYTIYFNNTNWQTASKFTISAGETLTIKAGVWTSSTGHTLTFGKDLVIYRGASGYSVAPDNIVSYSFGRDDLGIGTGSSAATIYVSTTDSTLADLPFNNAWGTRLKAVNAVTYTPAGGEAAVLASTGVAVINGKLCFETGTGWTGVSFGYATVSEGDSFTIDGIFDTIYDETLYKIYVNFTSTYTGGAWTVPTYNAGTYDYDDSSITKVSTSVSAATDRDWMLLSIEVDQDDSFPVDSNWNAKSYMANGLTITPADGSDPITMDAAFLKNADRTYTMIMFKSLWPTENYDFQDGDDIKFNGSISGCVGAKQYTVNISKWEFVWNGTSNAFEAVFNRQALIEKVSNAISALGEPAATDEYSASLEAIKSDVNRMTSIELGQVDSDLLAGFYAKDRTYQRLVAEAAGKSVHLTTLTAEDITASFVGNVYDTGLQTKFENEIDFPIMDAEKGWVDYHNSNSKDVKVTSCDGNSVTYLNSAAVHEASVKITLIFVSWGPKNGYSFASGDRVTVSPTGYIYQTDTDFYELEYGGVDAIWCGKEWRDYADCGEAVQNYLNAANAIGTVEYTDECKAKIDAAQAAYDALSEGTVSIMKDEDLAILTDAIKKYNALINQKAADEVTALINAIGTVEYTDECKARIDAARAAYDGASEDVKALISDEQLKVLTDAEAEYVRLGNRIAADAVVDLINAIGTVEYTDECKAKIDAAREAYDALSDDAKELIDDATYQVLLDAESRYDVLKAEDDFVRLVNTLDESSSADQIYSTVSRALSLYNKIENKESEAVKTAYAKLLTFIEKYNEKIAVVNDAHSEANSAAENMVGLAVAAPSLLALLALALSKKGLF